MATDMETTATENLDQMMESLTNMEESYTKLVKDYHTDTINSISELNENMESNFASTNEAILSEEKLSKEILEDIEPYVKTSLSTRIKRIIEVLKLKNQKDRLPMHDDRVHFKNGTYYLGKGFVPEKEFCSNRLPVNYDPEAKKPTEWFSFLNELLYEEDIPTLQEYMGYCMIPTTIAQAMLMMIGTGGEGKSRVGLVMKHLLGENMNICSITKLANNKFHFTISDRAKKNLEESKKEDDNILEFFELDGYIMFDPGSYIATKELYDIYYEWCEDNGERARVMSSFSKFLKVNAQKYGLTYDKNIQLRNGKKVRGYHGVCEHPGPNPFENVMKAA